LTKVKLLRTEALKPTTR